jgi:hypothetical protein
VKHITLPNLGEETDLLQEEEEPDRLTLLLPQSKFDCTSKKTGYYADDGLNCEVFHYCQDNARHSWICPEGFLFHQVCHRVKIRNRYFQMLRSRKVPSSNLDPEAGYSNVLCPGKRHVAS